MYLPGRRDLLGGFRHIRRTAVRHIRFGSVPPGGPLLHCAIARLIGAWMGFSPAVTATATAFAAGMRFGVSKYASKNKKYPGYVIPKSAQYMEKAGNWRAASRYFEGTVATVGIARRSRAERTQASAPPPPRW